MRSLITVTVLVAVFALACDGGGDAATSSPTPSPTATRRPTPTLSPSPSPSPTPEPTLAPTAPPAAPTIDVSGSAPRQGGFLVVRLLAAPDAPSATAYFTGLAYTMLFDGEVWYSYIGLGTGFTIGDYPIEVWTGHTLLAAGNLSVAEGGFDFVDITIPEGPAGLLEDPAPIEEERLRVEAIESVFTPEKYWSGSWIVPTVGTITSNFGEMRSINGGAYYPHSGNDIANDEGTPVYAAATGFVAMADTLYLYGNSVIIDHGVGVFSSYNHMQQFVIAPGQYVIQGDLIGYMGTTGLSSGPHLHWEAIVHNVRVNPRLFTEPGIDP